MSKSFTMMFVPLFTAAVLAVPVTSTASASTEMSNGSKWTKIEARLSSSGDAEGKVKYRVRAKNNGVEERAEFKIKKATPDTTYDVSLNGDVIGSLTTNREGKGKLKLKTNDFPADFTGIFAGDILTVGPASGAAWDKSGGGNRFKIEARMRSDTDRSEARLKYRLHPRKDMVERTIEIRLKDAAADTTFDVLLNGVAIASMTTNSRGRADLKMRNRNAPMGSWALLPADFPGIFEGDTITIGTTTGQARAM